MLTAKSHGLYWLFVPGFAILTKMATYLNESPTFFVIGKEFEECERVSEKLPRIEYKLCEDDEQAAKYAGEMQERVVLRDGRILLLGEMSNALGDVLEYGMIDRDKELARAHQEALGEAAFAKMTLWVDNALGASLPCHPCSCMPLPR